jgi:hypothetical protein
MVQRIRFRVELECLFNHSLKYIKTLLHFNAEVGREEWK